MKTSIYMEPDSPNAHLDFPPLATNERGSAKYPIPAGSVSCPKCNGWGGWNLKLNAYGPGKHFKAGCDQCIGWGHVKESDSKCVHDWANREAIGDCLNRYTCSNCGTKRVIDSSG